jgi:Protein of unknown function (DUF2723)
LAAQGVALRKAEDIETPKKDLTALRGGASRASATRVRRLALHASRLAGMFLVLAAAALYLSTLDNGLRPGELTGGDLITHQYAQVQARFGNAPGYPLYTMGGWLWFHAGRLLLGPAVNPISLLSSYSTLWALLALWLLYRLILEATDRGYGGNWQAALLACGFYAVTFFFWYYAVTTEEYASAVAWTLAVLLMAFRWQRGRHDRYLLGISLLAGAGLAHILTILIIIPPLLWFVLRDEPRLLRRPGLIATAIALAALPLLSYAYVYIRGAQHPEWRGVGQWTSTWQWFWSFISTQQGRAELTWSWQPLLTAQFPALIVQELTPIGLLGGLVGLRWLGGRRAIAVYATLVIYLALCWIDRLGNWFQVIMPAYALVALGLGVGADRLWRAGRAADRRNLDERGDPIAGSDRAVDSSRTPSPARLSVVLRVAIVATLAGLIIDRAVVSYPQANSHDRAGDTGLAPGWAILADNPPPHAGVLGTLPEELALNYLTEIWGLRSDVEAITSDQARQMLAGASRPLAVTVAALPLVPQEVSPDAHYSALGSTVVSITARPATTLPTAERSVVPGAGLLASDARLQFWEHDFGDGLSLVGGRVTRNPAGGDMVVRLAWQASARPAQNWSVSVRLMQGDRETEQVDQEIPVAGAYPTSRWSVGETVGDAYSFALPAGARPDGVRVILYRRAGDGSFVNLGEARFRLR